MGKFIIDKLKKKKWFGEKYQEEILIESSWFDEDEYSRLCIVDNKEKLIYFDLGYKESNEYVRGVIRDIWHDYKECDFDIFGRK